MSDSPLVAFYRGTGRDHAGRSLEEIQAWGHDRLEGVHDYIQWLFPLDTPSAYNPHAPILTPADITAFHNEAPLRMRLRASLRTLLDFYGLVCDETAGVSIGPSAQFEVRARNWLTPGNHNHQRLTRILRSLTLLGLASHARALLHCLEAIRAEHPQAIDATTLAYWRRAIS